MKQLSLFNQYKIDKSIRLIELFAGIGAQAKALENLNVDFEKRFVCDFDKYAICSYNAIHNTFYKGKDKSNSQLYKQAGNSIVVNVLEAIFKQML